jgi:uncharacterized protein YgiM (DUF1202 family)
MKILIYTLAIISILACGISAPLAMVAQSTATASPVKKSEPTNAPILPTPHIETVTALESLNVRDAGNDNARILAVLIHGNPVIVIGECIDGWVQIGGGFVNADFISGNLCEAMK